MNNIKITLLVLTAVFFINSQNGYAASQNACAIWICLPGGFPSGCGGAYSEFKNRIKKGRNPLPSLSSCTTGPNGEKVSGRYELGYERFEPCEDGYVLRERLQGYRVVEGACYNQRCAPSEFQENSYCENYAAILRPKPHFVKMWVNGDYLGQYFYQ